jgi:hypothetical protein
MRFMRRYPILVTIAALLCWWMSPAGAQTVVGRDPTRFFTLGDLGDGRVAGLEINFGHMSSGDYDVSVMAFDLHLDAHVTPYLKVFARVPILYGHASGGGDSTSDTGIGNLSFGGRLVRSSGAGQGRVHLGLGASVGLDTASDDTENVIYGAASFPFHLEDPFRYIANVTTLQLEGDLQVQQGMLSLQAQVALQHFVLDDADDRNYLKLNVGLAAQILPQVSLIGEVVTLCDAIDDDEDTLNDDDFVHTLNLGARISTGQLDVAPRLILPLDEDFRDEDAIGFAVDVVGKF